MQLSPMMSGVMLSMALSAGVALAAPELTLFDFRQPLPEGVLETRSATATVTEQGRLRLTLTPDPGNPWPGITLKAPGGKWDLSKYGFIHLRVSNGPTAGAVGFRVDNVGADGNRNCLQQIQDVVAGQSYEFAVPLTVAGQMSVRMFGMRGYPIEINNHAAVLLLEALHCVA